MKYIHMFLTATLFLTASSSITQSTPMQDATQNEQQISCCDRKKTICDRKTIIAEIVKIVSETQEKIKQDDIHVTHYKKKLISLLSLLVCKHIITMGTTHKMGLDAKKLFTCGLLSIVGNAILPIIQTYKPINNIILNTLSLSSLYFLMQICISATDVVYIWTTENSIQSEILASLNNATNHDISDIPTTFLNSAMNRIERYASDLSLLNGQDVSKIKENIQNDKAEIEERIKNL